MKFNGGFIVFSKSLMAGIALIVLPLSSFGADRPPLRVVENLDLKRYEGRWYEAARLPNRFQKKCTDSVTAEYTLQPDSNIEVLNRCRVSGGKEIQAKGVARKAAPGGKSSVLKVRFAPAFLSFIPQVWGDYQVLALDADYRYAVVGDPSREYLWILSRDRNLDPALYDEAVRHAREQGFDVDKLVKTAQP